jgi:DNA-binding response OmpR family regulator
MGAADYITKPFSPLVFRARVRRQLLLRGAADGAAAL